MLPNGLVKLINALPFICGDFRAAALGEIWAGSAARGTTRGSRVRRGLATDPGRTRTAAPMGLSLSPAADRPAGARRSAVAAPARASARWCATASSSTRACFPTCSARPGPTPSPMPSTRTIFFSGLAGVVLAVVGVEAFNEYFDSRMGTDRVFNPADLPPMTDAVLWLGIAAFAGALAVGIYLTVRARLADPRLRAARRRGGDLLRGAADPLGLPRPRRAGHRAVVRALDGAGQPLPAHPAAVVAGAVRVAGAGMPDHGARRRQRDPRFPPGPPRRQAQPRRAARPPARRLPVPRRWRRRACSSCRSASPPASSRGRCLAALLALPLLVESGRVARSTYETPRAFVPAVRNIVACYLVAVLLLTAGILSRPAGRCAHEPHRPARRAAARLVADHARLRPVLPALLHRIGAGQAPARRARRRRGDARRRRDHPRAACPT